MPEVEACAGTVCEPSPVRPSTESLTPHICMCLCHEPGAVLGHRDAWPEGAGCTYWWPVQDDKQTNQGQGLWCWK